LISNQKLIYAQLRQFVVFFLILLIFIQEMAF